MKSFVEAFFKTLGMLTLAGAAAIMLIAAVFVFMSATGICIDAFDCNMRADDTREQLHALVVATKLFARDCGRFPSFDEGLDALLTKPPDCRHWKPYLEEPYVPRDAWDAPFAYVRVKDSFEIRSYGRDGTPYTADDLVETSPGGGL